MKRALIATLIALAATSAKADGLALFCERVAETCVSDECQMSHARTKLALGATEVVATGGDAALFGASEVRIKNTGLVFMQEQMKILLNGVESDWMDREQTYAVYLNETKEKTTYVLVGTRLFGGEKMTGQVWYVESNLQPGTVDRDVVASLSCSK